MEMRFKLLRAVNSLFAVVVFLMLFAVGSYSVFALWDDNRVYTAVDDVMGELQKLKPETIISDEDTGPDFTELRAINEDVCAWVTMDGTAIDYPVLQGENNMSYINRDAYGEFALAGSIFLDSRNAGDYSDPYSLLYGHHMENSKMFGDLDLYKDKKFFDENTTGTLLVPGLVYDLEIFACIMVNASDDYIFEPQDWHASNIDKLLNYVSKNALYVREDMLNALKAADDVQILALSTCSSDFTDARTIVLAVMTPHGPDD